MTDIMVLEKIDEKLQKEHGLKLYHSAKKNRTYYTDKKGVFLRLQFRPKDPADLVACFVVDKEKFRFAGLDGKWAFEEIASSDDFGRVSDGAFLNGCANKIMRKLGISKPQASKPTENKHETVKIGSTLRFGEYDWVVLAVENNRALLITEKIIEERRYNNTNDHVTWETCDLRAYLNNEFYNKLGESKSAIAEIINVNPNNPWYDAEGGNRTMDKVFLLSIDEVCRYFGDSTAKLKIGGRNYLSDANNATRKAKRKEGLDCIANWLRSPGNANDWAACVNIDGSILIYGLWFNDAQGIRPALWINL